MKKNLFIGALAVFALTACSQDEVVDTNQYGNEIGFTAVANKGSRAKDLFCNANLPQSINVSAYTTTDGVLYFKDETYSKGNTSYTCGTQRFWPESDALTFMATAGAELTKTQTIGSCEETFTYTVKQTVSAQEDVLYAVTTDATKTSDFVKEGVCDLNFRHALAQIVFKATNSSNNLYVKITGVSIHNALNKGTFKYSSDTREWWGFDNDNGHQEETTATVNQHTKGEWSGQTADASTNDYDVTFTEVTLKKGESKNLTDVVKAEDTTSYPITNANAMLLLPQENTSDVQIKVLCQVYNVANITDGYQEGDVAIFGKEAPANLVIDLKTFSWAAGNKYIYNINFGGKEGGKDEEGKDVFVPIEYSVTVDDFDLAGTSDVWTNPQ